MQFEVRSSFIATPEQWLTVLSGRLGLESIQALPATREGIAGGRRRGTAGGGAQGLVLVHGKVRDQGAVQVHVRSTDRELVSVLAGGLVQMVVQ